MIITYKKETNNHIKVSQSRAISMKYPTGVFAPAAGQKG